MSKIFCFIPISFVLIILFAHPAIGQDSTMQSAGTADTLIQPAKPRAKYFKSVSVIIPATFILYGSLKPVITGIQNTDNDIMDQVKKKHPGFHTPAADYLMWAPSASVYVLDALSVKTAHSFKEHLIIDAGSLIVTGGVGFVMRKITGNIAVYNKYGTQFPSGHTANVFRGAEILHQELKDSHPVLSYSGYLVGVAVGTLRIYTKDHFLTEVLAGAGLGILSTKLTYWVFDRVKDRKKKR